eukprot:TRINITY_DN8951_c0_g1_i1.p1 TRINITY_DN8951_c0_g1~~TRINITY_DN8951_c0_g1_i1.p1  ORF type:complete len:1127 (+),score=190.19 TRINITY_DN8951_c0_g1_i1:78-3458(+)
MLHSSYKDLKTQVYLDMILNSPKYLGVFKDFLESEFCLENYLFWEECYMFRYCTKEGDIIDKGMEIYNKFLNENSAIHHVTLSTRNIAKTDESINNGNIDIFTFEGAFYEVWRVMHNDLLNRFFSNYPLISDELQTVFNEDKLTWSLMIGKVTKHAYIQDFLVRFKDLQYDKYLFYMFKSRLELDNRSNEILFYNDVMVYRSKHSTYTKEMNRMKIESLLGTYFGDPEQGIKPLIFVSEKDLAKLHRDLEKDLSNLQLKHIFDNILTKTIKFLQEDYRNFGSELLADQPSCSKPMSRNPLSKRDIRQKFYLILTNEKLYSHFCLYLYSISSVSHLFFYRAAVFFKETTYLSYRTMKRDAISIAKSYLGYGGFNIQINLDNNYILKNLIHQLESNRYIENTIFDDLINDIGLLLRGDYDGFCNEIISLPKEVLKCRLTKEKYLDKLKDRTYLLAFHEFLSQTDAKHNLDFVRATEIWRNSENPTPEMAQTLLEKYIFDSEESLYVSPLLIDREYIENVYNNEYFMDHCKTFGSIAEAAKRTLRLYHRSFLKSMELFPSRLEDGNIGKLIQLTNRKYTMDNVIQNNLYLYTSFEEFVKNRFLESLLFLYKDILLYKSTEIEDKKEEYAKNILKSILDTPILELKIKHMTEIEIAIENGIYSNDLYDPLLFRLYLKLKRYWVGFTTQQNIFSRSPRNSVYDSIGSKSGFTMLLSINSKEAPQPRYLEMIDEMFDYQNVNQYCLFESILQSDLGQMFGDFLETHGIEDIYHLYYILSEFKNKDFEDEESLYDAAHHILSYTNHYLVRSIIPKHVIDSCLIKTFNMEVDATAFDQFFFYIQRKIRLYYRDFCFWFFPPIKYKTKKKSGLLYIVKSKQLFYEFCEYVAIFNTAMVNSLYLYKSILEFENTKHVNSEDKLKHVQEILDVYFSKNDALILGSITDKIYVEMYNSNADEDLQYTSIFQGALNEIDKELSDYLNSFIYPEGDKFENLLTNHELYMKFNAHLENIPMEESLHFYKICHIFKNCDPKRQELLAIFIVNKFLKDKVNLNPLFMRDVISQVEEMVESPQDLFDELLDDCKSSILQEFIEFQRDIVWGKKKTKIKRRNSLKAKTTVETNTYIINLPLFAYI